MGKQLEGRNKIPGVILISRVAMTTTLVVMVSTATEVVVSMATEVVVIIVFSKTMTVEVGVVKEEARNGTGTT